MRQRAYPQTEREVNQILLISLIVSLLTDENRVVIPASYMDNLAGQQANLFIDVSEDDNTLIVEVEFEEPDSHIIDGESEDVE
jgi:DNA-binding transcriptional regulator/RsmH inhibitor MraZ